MHTWPILVIYIILVVWIFHFIFTFRRQISCMAAMMSAMVLGMTIGLGAGTLLGFTFPGQPFQFTISGMMIGGTVGFLTGLPISIMAVLDGLLSGVMGGLMGAMLMLMLPPTYASVTLRIIGVLCSGILFILFIMLQGEVKPEHLKQKFILLSGPQPLFIFIAAFFLLI